MIRSCLSTFILLFFLATSVTAQNVTYPIGLSVKNLFLDYQSSNGGDISNFSAYDQGFEISVQRAINDKVSIDLWRASQALFKKSPEIRELLVTQVTDCLPED